jgi:carbon monoxide dehydrogenase subunit G
VVSGIPATLTCRDGALRPARPPGRRGVTRRLTAGPLGSASVPQVIFAREAVVPAGRERVWEIVVDPARRVATDPRRSLVATTGVAGATGSGYVVDVLAWPRTLRVEHSVTQADPGTSITIEARRAGRLLAVHEGTLAEAEAEAGGTRLIWLVRAEAAPGLGWLVSYRGRQELARWIAEVVRAAEPSG